MTTRIGLCLLVALVFGCSSANPLLESEDGKRVDKYLRDNVADKDFEVVRWWPTQEHKELYDKLLREAKMKAEIAQKTAEAANNLTAENLEMAKKFREPRFVEVAVESQAEHARAVKELDVAVRQFQSIKRLAPLKAARVKIRHRNQSGNPQIDDFILLTGGEKLEPAPNDLKDKLMKGFAE